jgi:hypothetical protein
MCLNYIMVLNYVFVTMQHYVFDCHMCHGYGYVDWYLICLG